MAATIDRQQVVAYRAFAQGLHREATSVDELGVLDLGVQDTPAGSAAHALVNRLPDPPADPTAEPGLFTTWSVRGAPHVHRADDHLRLARALWPGSDADALTRLTTAAVAVEAAGLGGLGALALVAGEIADIVDRPQSKGDVSTQLTPRIPAELTVDCRRCKATHVVESLFRLAVLPAGITFAQGQRVVTFAPTPGWPGVPQGSEGADRLIATYLRLLGPATKAAVGAFLGTRAAEVAAWWPAEAVEVAVDGRRVYAMEDSLDALTAPPEPPDVRLLPPSDPLLQARDRELIVPEAAHRKTLWPILGKPGAVLVAGDVAGSWRARRKGRRVEVEVQPFGRLPASAGRAVEREASLLALARGAKDAAVTFSDV